MSDTHTSLHGIKPKKRYYISKTENRNRKNKIIVWLTQKEYYNLL